MIKEKYCRYRGNIQGLVTCDETAVFVTLHPEDQATAIYRIHFDDMDFKSEPLPAGAVDLISDQKFFYIAGSDCQIYKAASKEGNVNSLGKKFSSRLKSLALLSQDRLAVLSEENLWIIARKTGKLLQKFSLKNAGSALAADDTGGWLAVGMKDGTISVYECESGKDFQPGDSKKIHQGPVSSLFFEPGVPYLWSAGVDLAMYRTHARGALEPENRSGGKSHHEKPMLAWSWGKEGILYTSGDDGSLKTWTIAKKRPVTLKNAGKAVALAPIIYRDKPHLVMATRGNALRLLPIDKEGKVDYSVLAVRDAYAFAKNEFKREPTAREKAIKELISYDDKQAIDIIAEQGFKDKDAKLRGLCVKLLGKTKHARAAVSLEKFLISKEGAMRIEAFHGLRQHHGEKALKPLETALQCGYSDVGELAVAALEKLAQKDDHAMAILIKGLNSDPFEIAKATMSSLEKLFADDPQAQLLALTSHRPDLRKLALVRLFQRKLSTTTQAQIALRRHMEDNNPDVRLMSFLVSITGCEKLAKTLRARDKNLHRQVYELENYGKKIDAKKSLPKIVQVKLEEKDKQLLFQMMSCRITDTCLRGAIYLAALQDSRAFGTLLQLSRDREENVRVQVCRAFQELNDSTALKRLSMMLQDQSPQVRDAAFTALAKLYESEITSAVETGFTAEDVNIRRRALQLLLSKVKKSSKKVSAKLYDLLERALNDASREVFGETFKTISNMKLGGSKESALKFSLKSMHADLRRDIMAEITADYKNTWAQNLLLEMLEDPEAGLRKDVFLFMEKQCKGKKEQWLVKLEKAMGCRYADVREKAIKSLAANATKGSRELLEKALKDQNKNVRALAIDALIAAEEREILTETCHNNEHSDMRLRAAVALTAYGDKQVLPILLEIASEKKPETTKVEEWENRVITAISGLASLGNPQASELIQKLIHHDKENIQKEAAKALFWVTGADNIDPLRKLLRHSSKEIRKEAAYGLGYYGDPNGVSLINWKSPGSRELGVALSLESHSDEYFLSILDSWDYRLKRQALVLALLLEMSEYNARPHRFLALLAAKNSEARLTAAQALEVYSDKEKFEQMVVNFINDHNSDKKRKLELELARKIGNALATSHPHLRTLMVEHLLPLVSQCKWKEFDREWRMTAERFKDEWQKIIDKKSKKVEINEEELKQITFGAYIGLARQGVDNYNYRWRQTALSRLVKMADKDASLKDPCLSVLTLALRDVSTDVREQAFNSLVAAKFPLDDLTAEVLAGYYVDTGERLLKLLARKKAKKAISTIEMVMKEFSNGLESKTLDILIDIHGKIKTLKMGLEAKSAILRESSLQQLVALSEKEPEALKLVYKVLESRHRHMRYFAAELLAERKDARCFDVLGEKIKSEDHGEQVQAINSLLEFGDPKIIDVFLHRIDNDPAGTAVIDSLFEAIGQLRDEKSAEKLFPYLEKENGQHAFQALLKISGYDQPFHQGPYAPANWQEKQFPRNIELLAKILESATRIVNSSMLKELMPQVRWARGNEVEKPLAELTGFPDKTVRYLALEAIGWRICHRKDNHESLVRVLESKDPTDRFLAAEGLAKIGKDQGINILLSAMELLPDINFRQRAVKALGFLGDKRTLDPLLNLATQEGHALQDVAATAIGHLSQTDKSEEILKLLKKQAEGEIVSLQVSALAGLRWFNTRESWIAVRNHAQDEKVAVRLKIAELLKADKDPASRDILEKMIREDVFPIAKRAAASMRKMMGEEALETDYAILQSKFCDRLDENAVKRVCEKGTPEAILQMQHKISSKQIADTLVQNLTNRSPLPIKDAIQALDSNEWAIITAAARILGYASAKSLTKQAEKLNKALAKVWDKWQKLCNEIDEGKAEKKTFHSVDLCLEKLLWACIAIGKGQSVVRAVLIHHDPRSNNCRFKILIALSNKQAKSDFAKELAELIVSDNEALRKSAAICLRESSVRDIAEKSLDDFSSAYHLLKETKDKEIIEMLGNKACSVHYQSVVIPHLIKHSRTDVLQKVAADRSLPVPSRLGAIEALAHLGKTGEKALQKTATDKKEDAEMRKAAWRALRRAKRYSASKVEK